MCRLSAAWFHWSIFKEQSNKLRKFCFTSSVYMCDMCICVSVCTCSHEPSFSPPSRFLVRLLIRSGTCRILPHSLVSVTEWLQSSHCKEKYIHVNSISIVLNSCMLIFDADIRVRQCSLLFKDVFAFLAWTNISTPSSVFLASQFEYLVTYIEKLIPESKKSFLSQFLFQVRQVFLHLH